MSRLGFKSLIYHGDSFLGEVEIFPAKNQHFQFPNNEIRINYLSPPSERCPPLSIFQTIAPYTIRCKLESKFTSEQSLLYRLYSSCFQELKTAVVLVADEELHLVAMPSKQERFPCFWCFAVPLGLYKHCLGMLNLRCLAIVFDLDETLIVANTMKSFEDKIDALQRRLACEFDPLRVSGITAELKRYIEDKSLLKQYAEGDYVMDNGRLLKVQHEEVPPLPGHQEGFIRPVIRVPERNIVLTRINPEIRDTSVLVRLRPAWEDLRSYLTAKGRKRFEVYVCTMAEKDYALEMWRLLDPETHLISSNQLLDRVVCVKSGSRKSLLNVFQGCICHPKMAMVIDDRLKVWEDKDQPRVHVVPPFTPYYAPQAETANAVPVLCVARNVACNVRAGFFKEFDENLLRKIAELCFEDEVASLPYAPDVSDYMMSEDASFIPNINRDIPITEGMNGIEVERRSNQSDDKSMVDSATPLVTNNHDLRPDTSQQPVAIPSVTDGPADSRTDASLQRPSLLGGGRREVNPSELDYEARRRLLIMHHGQDLREQNLVNSSILSRPASIQPRGGWLVEEDLNVGHTINRPSGLSQESDVSDPDKQQAQQTLLHPSMEDSVPPHASQVKNEPAYLGQERQKPNHSQPNPSFLPEGDEKAPNQAYTKSRQLQTEAGKFILHPPSISIGVLQEIGRKCSSKVEFKSIVNTSKDLQFSVEVLFSGEKIGVGMGKTKKDAQQQAADKALQCLAEKYLAHIADSGVMDRVLDKLSLGNENGFLLDTVSPGFLLDTVSPGLDELAKEVTLPNFSTEAADEELDVSKPAGNQQMLKRANSPRSPQNIPSKRSKEELLRGLPGLPSSQYQKNGSPVS